MFTPRSLCAPLLVALFGAVGAVGCATSARDSDWVHAELEIRLGVAQGAPPAVDVADGLDQDEVVALVLWQHPALEVELTRVDSARVTLDEAGRPTNPQLSLFGPIGPADLVATLIMPIESAWQIPSRTEAAARDVDATAEAAVMLHGGGARFVARPPSSAGAALEMRLARASVDG